MNASTYQVLASRTECDQDKSRHKMFGSTVTSSYGHWDEARIPIRLNHAIIGAMGELGELAGCLEKWIYYGQELDKANVAEEIGDTLWYIALAANALGLDLGKIMEANIAKLKQRYPEKYTDQQAAEGGRDRAKEREVLGKNVAIVKKSAYVDFTTGEDLEPCCECGRFYPRIQLLRDGHVTCPSCRHDKAVVANAPRRTKKQVLEARKQASSGGCCSDWADMIRCNCLE